MVDDSDLQESQVVTDVSNDGDRHDEARELNVLNLSIEFLFRGSFQHLLDLQLMHFLWTQC